MNEIQRDVCVLFVAGLMLAGGSGAGRATESLSSIPPRDTFQVRGRPAFVIEPSAVVAHSRPWVWYAPTLGSTLPGEKEVWMFRRLLDSNVAIAGVDVGESYGSPAGRDIFQSFYTLLTEERGFSLRPVLLARSRGGLMHYSWAVDHPACVAGIAGIYPVGNLASYPGLDRAAPVYGLTAEEISQQLLLFNPPNRLAGLAAAGVPLLHLHGDHDKVVPLEENSGLIARRYREAGGVMELIVVPGGGHTGDSSWFESERLTAFMIEQAHTGATSKMSATMNENITLKGVLHGGQLAIGGETTGWVLEEIVEGDLKRIEVDMRSITEPERFAEKAVQITGCLRKRTYIERGEVFVLEATAVQE